MANRCFVRSRNPLEGCEILTDRKWIKMTYNSVEGGNYGVGIVLSPYFADGVVEVISISDRAIIVKLELGRQNITIISTTNCYIKLKDVFGHDLYNCREKLESTRDLVESDLNDHGWAQNEGLERDHGYHSFGECDTEGEAVMDFDIAKELQITNTFFQKHHHHLVLL